MSSRKWGVIACLVKLEGLVTLRLTRCASRTRVAGGEGGASRTGFKVTLCNDAVSVQYHFHEFDIEVA